MKNINDNHIQQARSNQFHKMAVTDVLVIPEVVQSNKALLPAHPPRKRRTNYVKKIMNDPFIFNV